MKEIKAYIRSERAQKVLDALTNAGFPHATLTHVVAMGACADPEEASMNIEFGRAMCRMVKLEVICPDQEEPRIVKVLQKAARTGQTGDGIISVQNINRLVKIRTAAESLDAL